MTIQEQYNKKASEIGHKALIQRYLDNRGYQFLTDIKGGELKSIDTKGFSQTTKVDLPLEAFELFIDIILGVAKFSNSDKYKKALTWAWVNNKLALSFSNLTIMPDWSITYSAGSPVSQKDIRSILRAIEREVRLLTCQNLTEQDKELFRRAKKLKQLEELQAKKVRLGNSDYYDFLRFRKQLSQYVAFN